MGEIHYTRVPRADWETEILKMKAAGVDIVSTYVIWNHHEEQPGEFNWSGERDLRAFVQLCAKHGLYFFVRPGPWVHSEVRFGGIPDWVVQATPTRSNDPTYLTYVTRYWSQVAVQLKGLYWKDGGPIIGMQIENEYNPVGPGQGPAHIAKLKDIARRLGMDVPLYTVTAWDRANYPTGEVAPVVSGYPDEPWATHDKIMLPKETYAFRFASRNAGDQGVVENGGTIAGDMAHTPFLGAEYAGGLPSMYRRRTVLAPDDIGAMLPVQLGSGANLYGYYMFHGGRNPRGHMNLEENTGIGAWNDLPLINYDFQAPFGENGEQHAVLGTIRPVHYFLRTFGEQLAPMAVHAPAVLPANKDDLTSPRYSVRSQGDSGFLFVSNHVRQYQMAVQKQVRFSIQLPGGTLSLPSKPIDIPNDAYFIWPLNLDLGGVRLAYATAQPITRLAEGANAIYFFFAQDGIPVELVLDGIAPNAVTVRSGKIAATDRKGRTLITGIKPGPGEAVGVQLPSGNRVRIVVLTQTQARILSMVALAGKMRLVLTPDEVFVDDGGLHLRSAGDRDFRFSVYPKLEITPVGSLKLRELASDGIFQVFASRAQARSVGVIVTKLRDAQPVPNIAIGGAANAALQPPPEVFGKSAAWSLEIGKNPLIGLADAILEIEYQGDVGRLFAGTRMIDDHYYNGLTWRIGLKAFSDQPTGPLMLTVLPLRQDAPIYIQGPYRPTFPASGQVSAVRKVRIVPEYQLDVRTGG
jgi:hypothetical protein